LLPVDGSAFAEEAIPYALGFARSTGAKMTVLQVAEHGGDVAAAEQYVRPLARRTGADGQVVVAETDTGKIILEDLTRHPHAPVVMTTDGRSGVREAPLGSVALSVVRDAG
jgi:nucleotide-binding universal stress UspA family protein